MDNALFSHTDTEHTGPGARPVPQEHRYGSLFLQPVYTAALRADGGTEADPERPRWAHDPSGRAHR
ncbi:hypothetical protein [Amycolatopsis sp. cmx-4-61]|uniref:hypothetical protein n=1 Tax=Amycolatopsis sp. cmx-4-61 TaxID=2790937 RepID=UPI00397848CD